MPISGGPQPWTDAFLDQKRLEGDPAADDAVAAVIRSGSLGDVNRLLRTLIRNDQPPPAELPEPIVAYLDSTSALPNWADLAKVRAGQEVFRLHGPLCLASLACASLPACYAQRAEARVLGTTQKLADHEQRRILETAQFLIHVMQPGGLEPLGRGVRTTQKVRLMHAAIRRLLTTPPSVDVPVEADEGFERVLLETPWDPALGLPICQEDLAFTLQTFSTVTLASLASFGVGLEDDEREAFAHAWAVVGFLIGLREEMIPANASEGQMLFDRIESRQQVASPDGIELTRAVERFIQTTLETAGAGGSFIAPRLTRITMRRLLPQRTADLLGVAPLGFWESLISRFIFRALDRFVDDADRLGDQDKLLRFIQKTFGVLIVRRLTKMPRGGQRQAFDIPDTLLNDWEA